MSVNGTSDVDTFKDSILKWTQPKFWDYCTTGETNYAIWSGLGGWNENDGQWRLIQGGSDTVQDVTGNHQNVIGPWWEMLTENTFNGQMFMGGPINPYDVVQSEAYYNTTNGYAEVVVYDITTGITYDSGKIYSLHGHSAAYYWDGSTSDFIAEAPTNSAGNIEQLRRTVDASVHFISAASNFVNLSQYGAWQIYQQLGSDLVNASSFDGVHSWDDTWTRCY